VNPLTASVPRPATLVRPARLTDVPALCELIAGFARRRLLLERSTGELYERIRDFLVLEDASGCVHGCAAVRIHSGTMAELRSLAVADDMHGRGFGRQLVEGCVRETRILGLRQLICLTYQVAFFARLGFTQVDRAQFPHKVWSDCIRCPDFLDCHEVAMWRTVADPPTPDPDAPIPSLPTGTIP